LLPHLLGDAETEPDHRGAGESCDSRMQRRELNHKHYQRHREKRKPDHSAKSKTKHPLKDTA
jgi:hypothetical protein